MELVQTPGTSERARDLPAPRGLTAAPRRILVADDNVEAAESLGYLLRCFGHQVTVVHDGVEAVMQAINNQPHIIILDIDMPKMNGYDVARHLRTVTALGPSMLIALTGFVQESDRQAAYAAGFDHHLAKPLSVPQLTAALEAYGEAD